MLSAFAVNSLAALGDLDSSFGSGGKSITNTGNNSTVVASVLQPDGKWYLLQSRDGFAAAGFGTTGDRPIQAAFIP